MAGPSACRVPQFVQVTGWRAGGGDDGISGARLLVEDADQLSLGKDLIDTVDQNFLPQLLFPLQACLVYFLSPKCVSASAAARRREFAKSLAGVSEDRQGADFVSVMCRNIDTDNSEVRTLEGSVRSGREIGEPRANAQNQVRLRCNASS